jgi:hypothetical protein
LDADLFADFFCISARAGDAIKAAAAQQLIRIKRLFFTIFTPSNFLFSIISKARSAADARITIMMEFRVHTALHSSASRNSAQVVRTHLLVIALLIKNRPGAEVSH